MKKRMTSRLKVKLSTTRKHNPAVTNRERPPSRREKPSEYSEEMLAQQAELLRAMPFSDFLDEVFKLSYGRPLDHSVAMSRLSLCPDEQYVEVDGLMVVEDIKLTRTYGEDDVVAVQYSKRTGESEAKRTVIIYNRNEKTRGLYLSSDEMPSPRYFQDADPLPELADVVRERILAGLKELLERDWPVVAYDGETEKPVGNERKVIIRPLPPPPQTIAVY